MTYAYQKDPKLQLALVEKMFEAYFEQEKDNGDPELLSTLAEETGVMSKAEVGCRVKQAAVAVN